VWIELIVKKPASPVKKLVSKKIKVEVGLNNKKYCVLSYALASVCLRHSEIPDHQLSSSLLSAGFDFFFFF
jgi:hypothetical protein